MIPPVAPSVLRRRRLGFAVANLLTYVAFLAALWVAMGWCWLTPLLVACAAAFLPWYVLGLWNAAIGLWLLARPKPPAPPPGPLSLRTAVVMTLRNEDPDRAIARLRIVQQSLDATGEGAQFGFFVLSDTTDAAVAAREELAMQAWRSAVAARDEPALPASRAGPRDHAAHAAERLRYRRRGANAGFKAGNIMEFCRDHADGFDLMLVLDADSLMSGPAIVHLVRLMQAHPRVGIVQGLVTGLPSSSAFARLFQFGMRAGMRSYTMGQAWWTGDCGPFWGHNAIVRIAPFREHCILPVLPGRPPFGGHILSHDQVEAALMRRGGWEVRLEPVAGGSYEDNPPTLPEYIGRDLRWCQGNLQYVKLLRLPGLHPVSRFQLVWAILMFIGLPAWTLAVALLPLAGAVVPAAHPALLAALYGLFVLMDLAPKLAGYLHSAAEHRRVARYGGRARFLAGAAAEIVFAWLKYGITSLHTTVFMLALLRGRSAAWTAQRRAAHAVSWRDAAARFWPHTAFGLAVNAGLLATTPALLPWTLPSTLGPLVAIPFAVLTASPRIGAWCARAGVCAVPEDLSPPAEVLALSDAPPPVPAPPGSVPRS